MTHLIYEIVERDGGWAHRVDAVISVSFPSDEMARKAAKRAAGEQRVLGNTIGISYVRTRTAAGATNCRTAVIDRLPKQRVDIR